MLSAALAVVAGCAKQTVPMKVYHYPLAAQTLTALTADKILSWGEACMLSSPEDVQAMSALIASAQPTSAPFGDKFVRIRVDSDASGKMSQLAVIDNEGYVREGAGPVRQLAPDRLDAVVKLIADRCR